MSYAQKRLLNKRLPTYAGFFVLLSALGVTLFLSGNAFIFVSRATIGSDPKNVQVSNITDSSFTISYSTDATSVGTINYGVDPSTQNIALDDRDQAASQAAEYQMHFITVKNLAPATKYYYVIDSGSQKLENNGAPFEITTDAPLQNPPTDAPTLTGTVSLGDGSIPKEGIVYLTTQDSAQLSALINPDGTYQIPLNNLRSGTATDSATLTPDTIIQLQAVLPTQSSTVKLLESQATQVPKIVIPQNYDFTLGPGQIASGSAQIASGSAFPALATPAPVSSPEITTPTDTEAFKDQQPTFTGRALPQTEVDVTIQSQQEINAKIQSDSTGTWQFRPPVSLAPGKHTITIKSIDASGIIQTISRSFTVYAAGSQFIEPSVSPIATPSALPTAVVTPTVAPTEAATPTASPTIAVTPTSAQKITPTQVPVPKTGSSVLMYGLIATAGAISIGALLFFLSIV